MKLEKDREKIDKIDMQIIVLLAKRLDVVKEIAEYKKKNRILRYDKKREEDILLTKKEFARKNNLSKRYIEDIFKRIISESHVVEKEIMNKKRSGKK